MAKGNNGPLSALEVRKKLPQMRGNLTIDDTQQNDVCFCGDDVCRAEFEKPNKIRRELS